MQRSRRKKGGSRGDAHLRALSQGLGPKGRTAGVQQEAKTIIRVRARYKDERCQDGPGEVEGQSKRRVSSIGTSLAARDRRDRRDRRDLPLARRAEVQTCRGCRCAPMCRRRSHSLALASGVWRRPLHRSPHIFNMRAQQVAFAQHVGPLDCY